jgi:phenylpropionate dioxygenase-like ring-hydroxylating dioxygenase large terminal subunit
MSTADEATQLDAFWYVVARSGDLRTRPVERRVNGRRIVLFRDEHGAACALDARCPHRGANLAHGRVERGCVTCPYHGWSFDGAGRCVDIPSQPKSRVIPASFVARRHPVIEQQGLVWALVGEEAAAAAPPPTFPALDRRDLHAFAHEEVVPVPFDWWVENALDVAHVPYVHRATYGAQNALVEKYAVTRRTDELGFTAKTKTRQEYSFFTRLIHRSARHFEMDIDVTFDMPGSVTFDIDLGGKKRQILLFLSTPEDGERTRIWILVLRNYLRVPGGDAVGAWFLRTVVREDVKLAASAITRVTRTMPRPLSVAADEPSLEFLRLLSLWHRRERRAASGTELREGTHA